MVGPIFLFLYPESLNETCQEFGIFLIFFFNLLFIFPVSLTKASIHNQTVLTSASPDRCLRCLTSSMRSSKNPVWAKRRQNWEECIVEFRSIPLSVRRYCISNPVVTRAKGGNSVMYVLPISRIIWRENWTLRSTKPTATAKRKKSSS